MCPCAALRLMHVIVRKGSGSSEPKSQQPGSAERLKGCRLHPKAKAPAQKKVVAVKTLAKKILPAATAKARAPAAAAKSSGKAQMKAKAGQSVGGAPMTSKALFQFGPPGPDRQSSPEHIWSDARPRNTSQPASDPKLTV